MLDVKVLGTGCPSCKKLEAITRQAIEELGIQARLENVKEINRIIEFGVMFTPALVINGEVKFQGRIPKIEEIKACLTSENQG